MWGHVMRDWASLSGLVTAGLTAIGVLFLACFYGSFGLGLYQMGLDATAILMSAAAGLAIGGAWFLISSVGMSLGRPSSRSGLLLAGALSALAGTSGLWLSLREYPAVDLFDVVWRGILASLATVLGGLALIGFWRRSNPFKVELIVSKLLWVTIGVFVLTLVLLSCQGGVVAAERVRSGCNASVGIPPLLLFSASRSSIDLAGDAPVTLELMVIDESDIFVTGFDWHQSKLVRIPVDRILRQDKVPDGCPT